MKALESEDPRRVGEIELHGRLGEGGMGRVYFGLTPAGDRVAVKVIHKGLADRPEVRKRFDREILALQTIQGPRIAALLAASEPEDQQAWLAMEYVRGMTLKEYVDAHGRLPAELVIALGDQLLEAVTTIHTAGALHRDLKPANIIMAADGPKVIDFGLIDLADAEELTRTQELLGTPSYMSPEHVRSAKELTPATDVYSLGAVLLFAATTHLAYERDNIHALLYAICDKNTEPDLSGVPPSLTPIIGAMLTGDPDARPTSEQATEHLRELLSHVGIAIRDARVQLATLTYVERPDDPPGDLVPEPRRPRRRPRAARVPAPVVNNLAERLRCSYAASGRL